MVNRTPPQRRDSTVGLPPLSQLYREGRTQVMDNRSRDQPASEWEEESQAAGSSSRDPKTNNSKINVTERSRKRNSHGHNLRRYNPRRDDQTTRCQVPEIENSKSIELLNVLNSLREEMSQQAKEFQGQLSRQAEENKELRYQLTEIQAGRSNHQQQYSRCSPRAYQNLTESKKLSRDHNACDGSDRIRMLSPRQKYVNSGKREVAQGLSVRLGNGESPTFESWQHLMKANLRNYDHCFENEQEAIDHLFAQTCGQAMDHLTDRLSADHPEQYKSVDDMFELLAELYQNPHEREIAREKYNRCRMSQNESFSSFYGRFSALARKAHIGKADQLQDMYRKFHSELHRMAVDFMATNPDFQTALKRFHYYDAEINAIRAKNEKYRLSNWSKTPETSMIRNQFTTTSHVKSEQNQNSNLSDIRPTVGYSKTNNTGHAERKCYKCKDPNHFAKNCPLIQSSAQIRKIDGEYENNLKDRNTDIADEIDTMGESENEGP